MNRLYEEREMNIYVYDFDKTIYDGDSTIDFFFYCVNKKIKLLKYLPNILYAFIKYYLGWYDKTQLKTIFFNFLVEIDDIDNEVKNFWKINSRKIKQFYLEKQHMHDIIVSASPEFLLKPLCNELQVKDLIASRVDEHTGEFLSPNCYGTEKVKRLKEKYSNFKIMEFYSDSKSDLPLAMLAHQAFLVDGNNIEIWRLERNRKDD